MGNRKKVEEFILSRIDEIAPDGSNKKVYQAMFKKMTNKEFDTFMSDLKTGKIKLSIIAPNGKNILNVERNVKLSKKWGVKIFHRLLKGNDKDKSLILTNNTYMVLPLPFKRAVQSLIKKLSIPEDNKTRDMLTGQVTNNSKSGKLTMPEIQILSGMGLEKSLVELLKYRGGDVDGQLAMEAILSKYGEVTQETLERYATGVISTDTFRAMLYAMHLKNTL